MSESENPPLPVLAAAAVDRFRREGERGIDWVWLWAPAEQRAAVDDWLVRTRHPLAYQAGTPESRFRQLVREITATTKQGQEDGKDAEEKEAPARL